MGKPETAAERLTCLVAALLLVAFGVLFVRFALVRWIVAALIALVLGTMAFTTVRWGVAGRRLRRRLRDRTVLVYHRRRGWAALMENNVLPLLADRDVTPHRRIRLWRRDMATAMRDQRSGDAPLRRLLVLPPELICVFPSASCPFLVTIGRTGRDAARVTPLNETLRPLKALGKRSRDTQARVAVLLDAALRAHRELLAEKPGSVPES